MSKSLRWGILGTGNIARQFAAGMSTARRGSLAAVGSRAEASAAQFAANYRVARAHGSYDDLIADPEVDAVYLSLPNSMHHEWTLRCLRAGKHVLCEKPFATNEAQAQEMFGEATRRGLVLVEAFMYRSHPMTQEILRIVRGGVIGELKLIRTSFCYRTKRVADNIRFDPALAGGALMDIGCYCLDFSRLFAGAEPTDFQVTGHVHESGVDDLAAGFLNLRGGLTASFTCGMTVQADNTAYLCGSEGFIEIPVPWKPPRENATYAIVRATPPKMDGPLADVKPREARTVSAPAELYALEADDFAAAVVDRAPPRVTEAETVGTMHLLDAMRRRVGVEF
jgi:predicted dehydrogenase